MVQTIGIALGNSNCYVAACKDGGIEILLNDYSQRSTPSMVAFGDNCRLIGVDASQNQMMNLKNTIYDLLKIVGKPYKDLAHLELHFRIEGMPDGQVGVVVSHLREEKHFSIVQVLAMLFTKLKEIADATDCVINCPQFYDEAQYVALYQAASIAGLNPLHVIPDMSATALYYGYYRTSRDDKDQKILTFINFGQSCLQTMVALMSPREDVIKVLAAECEPDLGGRDFDLLLANHFIQSQRLELSVKSKLRLITECEKLKKQLSASSNELPISIECLISEDKDFSARIDRAGFEQLAGPLFKKIENCLRRTLQQAEEKFKIEMKNSKQSKSKKTSKFKTPEKNLNQPETVQNSQATAPDPSTNSDQSQVPVQMETDSKSDSANEDKSKDADAQQKEKLLNDVPSNNTTQTSENSEFSFKLHAVEIVGGSSRIPAFKRIVKDVFGLDASTTLNTDEAVARGCVLHCATLHPGVKVKREIKIKELKPITIDPKAVKVSKELREIEYNLCEFDRQWKSRMDARNSLEEFIFECRSKNQFLEDVDRLEEWLYEEGDNSSKEDFIVRLQTLKAQEESLRNQNKKSGDAVDKDTPANEEVDKMSCEDSSAGTDTVTAEKDGENQQ